MTTRTPRGSSWCARRTPIQLKGESSHVHFQQRVWRPDGRSRTQTPNGSKPTGPQHCPWEPHAPQQATVGHQTSSNTFRRAGWYLRQPQWNEARNHNQGKWEIISNVEITREMIKYAERHRSEPWMPTLKDRSLLTKTVCNHVFPSHWDHAAIYTNNKSCCTPEVNTSCQSYQLKKTSDQSPNIIPNQKKNSKTSERQGRN